MSGLVRCVSERGGVWVGEVREWVGEVCEEVNGVHVNSCLLWFYL